MVVTCPLTPPILRVLLFSGSIAGGWKRGILHPNRRRMPILTYSSILQTYPGSCSPGTWQAFVQVFHTRNWYISRSPPIAPPSGQNYRTTLVFYPRRIYLNERIDIPTRFAFREKWVYRKPIPDLRCFCTAVNTIGLSPCTSSYVN